MWALDWAVLVGLLLVPAVLGTWRALCSAPPAPPARPLEEGEDQEDSKAGRGALAVPQLLAAKSMSVLTVGLSLLARSVLSIPHARTCSRVCPLVSCM